MQIATGKNLKRIWSLNRLSYSFFKLHYAKKARSVERAFFNQLIR